MKSKISGTASPEALLRLCRINSQFQQVLICCQTGIQLKTIKLTQSLELLLVKTKIFKGINLSMTRKQTLHTELILRSNDLT